MSQFQQEDEAGSIFRGYEISGAARTRISMLVFMLAEFRIICLMSKFFTAIAAFKNIFGSVIRFEAPGASDSRSDSLRLTATNSTCLYRMGSRKRACCGQLDDISGYKWNVRNFRTFNAIDPVRPVFSRRMLHCVEKQVPVLCPPQRIWLDQALTSLVCQIYTQSVGSRKTNRFKGRGRMPCRCHCRRVPSRINSLPSDRHGSRCNLLNCAI